MNSKRGRNNSMHESEHGNLACAMVTRWRQNNCDATKLPFKIFPLKNLCGCRYSQKVTVSGRW